MSDLSNTEHSSALVAEKVVHWCCSNGVIMSFRRNEEGDERPTDIFAVTHAPIALEPFPFPRAVFLEAQRLAPLFNKLVDRIARNEAWLLSSLRVTGESDEFTGKLLQILVATQSVERRQKCYFGILRSDYMLHDEVEDPRTFLQVELNTIASSFGALSTKVAEMYSTLYIHRFDVPVNHAMEKIVRGMSTAHHEYVNQMGSFDSAILFVVQNNEGNFADQRHLEYLLRSRNKIDVFRASLADIYRHGQFLEDGRIVYSAREISVVYYRSGYAPADYKSEKDWETRLKIELSRAIKCPNIAYHLAGTKKVQQVLAVDGVLEEFLDPKECEAVRSVFAGLYNLSEAEGTKTSVKDVVDLAIRSPSRYIMKPQREGGGNNIVGSELSRSLEEMTSSELSAYILMDRIFPPTTTSTLMRRGQSTTLSCVCELGIYGVYIGYGGEEGEVLNEEAGYLLRVKPTSSDEGGVAAGYAGLSAPHLVD